MLVITSSIHRTKAERHCVATCFSHGSLLAWGPSQLELQLELLERVLQREPNLDLCTAIIDLSRQSLHIAAGRTAVNVVVLPCTLRRIP